MPTKRLELRSDLRPAALGATIVTATRREEPANRVPISMAVWTQEAMEASGIKSMTGVGSLTPGVEFDFFPDNGAGFYTNIAIRGVTDRNGTTTGIYVDDTPVPAAQADSFGHAFLLTFDLDRVEVLRGPQGAMFGGGTLGGAVRFIENQPSLTTYTALARTELAATTRGDPSYEVGAAAGGPIVPDVMGFRVSAWYRTDGGYVNRVDPFTGATVDDNANHTTSKSARGAVTFAPTERVHITPSLIYQSLSTRDSSSFYTYLSDPDAGELHNGKLLAQPFDDRFYLGSLKVTAGLRGADLSSVTSYFHRVAAATVDDTNNSGWGGWGNSLGPEYPIGYEDAITTSIDLSQNDFSQEIRLTSSGASLPWLAGVFYSNERTSETVSTVATTTPAVGPIDGRRAHDASETQLAAFGQLALPITKLLTASAALRITREKDDAVIGPAAQRDSVTYTTVAPRFSIAYQMDEDNLFYLTAAKGYRTGGVAGVLPPECGQTPDLVAPDTVWSYELGAKSGLFDGRMQLDASVFHIRWNDPQLLLVTDTPNACRYGGNAGEAVSNGFELATQVLLAEHFKAGLGVSYTDAHYTQTVSPGGHVIVSSGDALGTIPLVTSPWNLTASLEYAFALASGVRGNLLVEDAFHSHNPGPFYTDNPASPYYAPDRRADPSTNLVNLRTDVKWSLFDVALFVNNVFDSQPTVLRRNACCNDTLFYATTFRPRTIGITANWRF